MAYLWFIYGLSMVYPCLWLAFTTAKKGICLKGAFKHG
jgi:hypothetical protein